MSDERCRICGAETTVVSSDFSGYVEPSRYVIRDCASCLTMVADPTISEASVYEMIYRDPTGLPVYDRYAQYAAAIRKAKTPLDYLANRADIYWSVREFLAANKPKTVLEVGSGLGYLVYAMREAGYDATGIELSTDAVRQANATFGEHYRADSLADLAAAGAGPFDAVIATEVVEHVEDPQTFLAEALALVKPGGSLFITTPNRSFFSEDTLWFTDLPPIHLWWFSERSVTQLAKTLACKVTFTDFSAYNRAQPALVVYQPPSTPMFGADGRRLLKESFPIAFFRRLRVLEEIVSYVTRFAGFIGIRGRVNGDGKRRRTLAATLVR